jgi:hypothetical protein
VLTGAWITRFDLARNAWIQVAEDACVAMWASSGGDHAEGQICARRGVFRLGPVTLCPHHYKQVLADAREVLAAPLAGIVQLDKCVFPVRGAEGLEDARSEVCAATATARIGSAPVCDRHHGEAVLWHKQMRLQDAARERQAEKEAQERAREEFDAEMNGWGAQGSQVVYYFRRADGAIKIGTTTRLHERRITLQGAHGPLELLLTHCGAREREALMHAKFRDLLLEKREWFRGEAELLEWIASVRRKRANTMTRQPGTVALGRVLTLLREAREEAAA